MSPTPDIRALLTQVATLMRADVAQQYAALGGTGDAGMEVLVLEPLVVATEMLDGDMEEVADALLRVIRESIINGLEELRDRRG